MKKNLAPDLTWAKIRGAAPEEKPPDLSAGDHLGGSTGILPNAAWFLLACAEGALDCRGLTMSLDETAIE